MDGCSAKRAVLVAPNAPLEIWDGRVPSPAGGEVLLKTLFGGVCGTDVHLWKGEVELPGPCVLGHEGIGQIVTLGDGVTTDFAGAQIKPGDRVYWVPMTPCGRCHHCTVTKDPSSCEAWVAALFGDAKAPPVATYAQFALLPGRMPFYRIPDDTPSEAVIAFGCALPTVLQAYERIGGVRVGETVLVQGSGPVGLAATLVASMCGASQVIVIGTPARRLDYARRIGATEVIDLNIETDAAGRRERVLALTEGRGADLVFEAAGVVPAFAEGLELIAKGGRYVVVGLWSAPGSVAVEPRVLNNRNLTIAGSALFQARHVRQAIGVAQRCHRQMPMAEAVTHRFALEDAQTALSMVSRLETIKAVIVPN